MASRSTLLCLLFTGGARSFSTLKHTAKAPRSCSTYLETSRGTRGATRFAIQLRLSTPPWLATTDGIVLSSTASATEFPAASDVAAIEALFTKHSTDGLMTEEELRSVPAIKDILVSAKRKNFPVGCIISTAQLTSAHYSQLDTQEQGELLSTELGEIWSCVPKFPDEKGAEKIDVESFVQVYRDIDDLFEDDDDVVEAKAKADPIERIQGDIELAKTDEGGRMYELRQVFAQLTGNYSKETITFRDIRQWEDISTLIDDDELGEDELVSLWEKATGVKGMDVTLDFGMFVKFNDALDDLFEFDDEETADDVIEDEDEADDPAKGEEDAAEVVEPEASMPPAPLPVITDEDLPPGVLFSMIANEDYLVGRGEIKRWGELNDMLNDEDITQAEVDALFDSAPKAPGAGDMLDEEGFESFFDSIDNLFEDEDDGDDEAEPATEEKELKEELFELLEDLAKLAEDEGQQKCGLDCSELEQERVLEVVGELERESYNQVVVPDGITGEGAITKDQLTGTWELIYSSSSTMKYNEGLSGLAGGLTKFGGLQQTLSSSKFLSDVEYTEQLDTKILGADTEVKITGDWDLRTEVSLFTGKLSNVMTVTPDRVIYGPRSDKADHWKSLGPMNLLLLTYLDEDLRIMRGSTSTDTLVIWRRI